MHIIAAKAVCFREAMTPEFRRLPAAGGGQRAGAGRGAARSAASTLVSGGTDTHLFLVDLRRQGLTGKEAEAALERAGITVNKNTVPFDQRSRSSPAGSGSARRP